MPKGNESILIVDDESTLAEMLGEMLSRLGYKVTIRCSSYEAYELFKFRPEQFDLVITDYAMPKMSGERLAQRLRRIRSNIPIILCSGFSNHFSEERLREIGIGRNIKKPIVLREMAAAIREVLETA